MRLLLAVKSCRHDRDRGHHDTIRETWGSDVTEADLRFFVGQGDTISDLLPDEEVVNVPDDYDSLPFKTQAILRWALSQNYDYTFLCDTDTYIIPEKLLKCNFEQYDYYGLIQRPLGKTFLYDAISRQGKHYPGHYYPWASGGFGCFFSRKAADIIAQGKPDFWAEDVWVGQILNEQYNHSRVTIGDAKNLAKQCSWHFPAHEYNSGYDLKFGWMEKMYKEH